MLQIMKTNCRKKPLLFGELIAGVYDACGRQKLKRIMRLAIQAQGVEFRGHDRFTIS